MKIDLQKHWGDSELYYIGELCAKIIDSMKADGSVYLWTKEGKNGHNNGMFVLLDELCAYYNWDKRNITLDTTNIAASHNEYNIVYTDFSHAAACMEINQKVLPWNKEKYYGMFIGRANSSRIRAIHNHHKFEYKEHGISSFNDDLFNYMNKAELVDYFFHSGQTYQEMISIKPYSNIGPVLIPPITPSMFDKCNWSAVYEKIAIEIVCETSILPDCFDVSEKVFRAMYFKRPFLLIGSPNQLAFIRQLGYQTFNEVIPEDYDSLSGLQRVDRVFEILKQLIETKSIDTLAERCYNTLEHNHNLLLSECNKHKRNLIKAKYYGK
jgi:hypothetical protein